MDNTPEPQGAGALKIERVYARKIAEGSPGRCDACYSVHHTLTHAPSEVGRKMIEGHCCAEFPGKFWCEGGKGAPGLTQIVYRKRFADEFYLCAARLCTKGLWVYKGGGAR